MGIEAKLKNYIKSWLGVENKETKVPLIQPTSISELLQAKTALITRGNSGSVLPLHNHFYDAVARLL